jgi:hypothetical protein
VSVFNISQEEEDTLRENQEQEVFHSDLGKNTKFAKAICKIEIDPSCKACFDEKNEERGKSSLLS